MLAKVLTSRRFQESEFFESKEVQTFDSKKIELGQDLGHDVPELMVKVRSCEAKVATSFDSNHSAMVTNIDEGRRERIERNEFVS